MVAEDQYRCNSQVAAWPYVAADRQSSLGRQRRFWAVLVFCIQKVIPGQ